VLNLQSLAPRTYIQARCRRRGCQRALSIRAWLHRVCRHVRRSTFHRFRLQDGPNQKFFACQKETRPTTSCCRDAGASDTRPRPVPVPASSSGRGLELRTERLIARRVRHGQPPFRRTVQSWCPRRLLCSDQNLRGDTTGAGDGGPLAILPGAASGVCRRQRTQPAYAGDSH